MNKFILLSSMFLLLLAKIQLYNEQDPLDALFKSKALIDQTEKQLNLLVKETQFKPILAEITEIIQNLETKEVKWFETYLNRLKGRITYNSSIKRSKQSILIYHLPLNGLFDSYTEPVENYYKNLTELEFVSLVKKIDKHFKPKTFK